MSRQADTARLAQGDRIAAFESAMRRTGVSTPDRLLLKLYTAEEAAELLGMTLGTVRWMTSRGDLPCVKTGRRGVRYRCLDLLAWIEARSRPAAS